jgi:hypothetical protein
MIRLLLVSAAVGCALAAGAVATAAAPAARSELVMYESASCPWCQAWHRQVGVLYAKTEEGQLLPLRRVQAEEPLPEDLRPFALGPFTPTFLLLHCGREAGRIVGYPGEMHFWGLLDAALRQLRGADSGPLPAC